MTIPHRRGVAVPAGPEAPDARKAPEATDATGSRRRLIEEELSELDTLLARLPESSVLERAGLEARREELREELAKSEQELRVEMRLIAGRERPGDPWLHDARLMVLAAAGDEARLRRAFAELGGEIAEVAGEAHAGGALEALLRYVAATYQHLKSEQIAEMVESAAGPEAQEVVVTWLEEIEVRGEKKGQKAGIAKTLLNQLAARFGTVPPEARAKVQAADEVTLSRWAVRVLTARSIDDALADRRKAAPARKRAARATARRR